MQFSPEIERAVVASANASGLPCALVRAIVEQESAGNTHATRFEPDFYERYEKGKTPNFRPGGSSIATEQVGRATSWGLLQIMGETARAVGFIGCFPELCTPAVGLKWACEYLRRLRDRYIAEGWEVVLRAYNGGPGNRHNAKNTYPAEVLSRVKGPL